MILNIPIKNKHNQSVICCNSTKILKTRQRHGKDSNLHFQIMSLMCYPLHHRQSRNKSTINEYCRPRWIRTNDFTLIKRTLYQLSYRSNKVPGRVMRIELISSVPQTNTLPTKLYSLLILLFPLFIPLTYPRTRPVTHVETSLTITLT